MNPRRYENAEDFRRALAQRLRVGALSPVEVVKRRALLAFDRLLARTGSKLGDRVLLKGGLALRHRVEGARTTRDIDLRIGMSPDRATESIEEAASIELGDFFSYEIVADPRRPIFSGEGVPYEGLRFRVRCTLAGKPFVHPFGLDVGFGDPLVGEIEVRAARDELAFAGLAPPEVRLYPIETHIAEKLHAYSLPRARMNSRVKDLPDIALLASSRELSSSTLRRALETTFDFRTSHALPLRFEDPPSAWAASYRALAESECLPWPTLEAVTEAARAFLDPVLTDPDCGSWVPRTWRWARAV